MSRSAALFRVSRSLVFLGPLSIGPCEVPKGGKSCPGHDCDIRDVEYPCPERPDAYVQEVHDAALENAVNPVRCATGHEQNESKCGRSREPIPNRDDHERQQRCESQQARTPSQP